MATKPRIQVSISNEMMPKLNQVCDELGVSKSAILALALEEWLERRAKQKRLMNE